MGENQVAMLSALGCNWQQQKLAQSVLKVSHKTAALIIHKILLDWNNVSAPPIYGKRSFSQSNRMRTRVTGLALLIAFSHSLRYPRLPGECLSQTLR